MTTEKVRIGLYLQAKFIKKAFYMEKVPLNAKLTVCNGKQAGKTFILDNPEKKVIGRDNNCHIQILDKGISRNHTLVEFKDDHFVLVDLGSTNGTFVNNKITISKTLQSGDIIKIGQTEIRYEESKPQGSSLIMVDDALEAASRNMIMERVDVNRSLYVSSQKAAGKPVQDGKPDLTGVYLSTIYEVSNLVNAEHDLTKLFAAIMEKIMQVFKPDRGFLVMQEGENFHIEVEINLVSQEAQLSSTILKKTIHEGVSVLSANAMLDDRFSGGLSIVSQQIKSVMSVPLESSNQILGAIYVDSIGSSNRFQRAHLDLLAAIGKQAGIAVERTMLFQHYMEKEKLKQALEIAQSIQKSLLPSSTPKNFPFDLVGWNLSCDETGGDYYDYFELPDNKLGIAIGDVSGHGIGSALLMATARAFLKALAGKSHSIKDVINELNRLLCKDMEGDKFITLFYAELDLQSLSLSYVNAGHESPMLYQKKKKTFLPLESTGMPLGMMEDFEYDEQVQVQISPGDILVLSTDGITESMNPQAEQFGMERMANIVQKGLNKSANQIIKDCYDEVQKFCAGTAQRDDLTLVVLKFDINSEEVSFTRKIERDVTIKET